MTIGELIALLSTHDPSADVSTLFQGRRPIRRTGAPNGSVQRSQQQFRLPLDMIKRLDVESSRRNVSKQFLVESIVAMELPTYEEEVLGV